MLTEEDLRSIAKVMGKLMDEKLQPVNDFIDFAKTAILELLDESEEKFKQKIPERLKKLEDIHPGGQHSS